jgi:Autophagy protein ATG9
MYQLQHDLHQMYAAAHNAYHDYNRNQQQQQRELQDGLLLQRQYEDFPNNGSHARHDRRRRRFTVPSSFLGQIWTSLVHNNNTRYRSSDGQYPNSNNHDTNSQNAYFTEFGIPIDRSMDDHHDNHHHHPYNENDRSHNNDNINTPLEYQNHNGYVHLPHHTTPNQNYYNEGWANVSNLDVYFQNVHSYYYHRGLVPIITRGVTELITVYFTFALSIVLFVYIDWQSLSTCIDESSCQSQLIRHYMHRRPFHQWSFYNLWIILYILIFGMYCIVILISLIHTVQVAIHTKWIYEERLGISARKLQHGAIDWDRDVVSKFVALQESGQYRIVIPTNTGTNSRTTPWSHENDSLPMTKSSTETNTATATAENGTNGHHRPLAEPELPTKNNSNNTQHHHINALMIANRILRKENFMIALFNRRLLNISIPFVRSHTNGSSNHVPRFFCSSIEVGFIVLLSSVKMTSVLLLFPFMFCHRNLSLQRHHSSLHFFGYISGVFIIVF